MSYRTTIFQSVLALGFGAALFAACSSDPGSEELERGTRAGDQLNGEVPEGTTCCASKNDCPDVVVSCVAGTDGYGYCSDYASWDGGCQEVAVELCGADCDGAPHDDTRCCDTKANCSDNVRSCMWEDEDNAYCFEPDADGGYSGWDADCQEAAWACGAPHDCGGTTTTTTTTSTTTASTTASTTSASTTSATGAGGATSVSSSASTGQGGATPTSTSATCGGEGGQGGAATTTAVTTSATTGGGEIPEDCHWCLFGCGLADVILDGQCRDDDLRLMSLCVMAICPDCGDVAVPPACGSCDYQTCASNGCD